MAAENNQGFSILSALQQGVQALSRIGVSLSTAFAQINGTTTTAAAGSATLPANPVGFVVITLPSGQAVKVPYYD